MQTRTLIFDPFAGISGDMTVAALLDLGLGEDWLRDFVGGLGLGDVGVEVQRVNRRGIARRT
jgi:pyridinium-3,5-bisthiocarboxylic acid mononucleotide nickel chelatase